MKKIGVYLKKEFFLNQYLGDLIKRLLDSQDVEIYFFHFNKLSVDTKTTELHESIHSIDLTEISLNKFSRLINQVGIDLFICSSFRNLFDYSVLSVIKEQEIKTVYIEHGLPVIAPYIYNTILFKRYIKSYSMIFLKNLHMLLALKVKYLQILIATISGSRKSKYYFLFDFAMLYSDYSRIKYLSWFNNDYTKFYYSGFPLFSDNRESVRLKALSIRESKSVLYIHQPIVEDTLIKLSLRELCEKLFAVAKIVENAGYKFVIKLHPRCDSTPYNQILGDYLYKGDLSLTELIVYSEQVIGHFSSALAIALYFNKKAIKLHFPEFRVQGDEIFDEFCLISNSLKELEHDLRKDVVYEGNNNIHSIIGTKNTHYDRYYTLLKLMLDDDKCA